MVVNSWSSTRGRQLVILHDSGWSLARIEHLQDGKDLQVFGHVSGSSHRQHAEQRAPGAICSRRDIRHSPSAVLHVPVRQHDTDQALHGETFICSKCDICHSRSALLHVVVHVFVTQNKDYTVGILFALRWGLSA